MITRENVMGLNRLEEYREGNQLKVKAAPGGMPDMLWGRHAAFANTYEGCILLG